MGKDFDDEVHHGEVSFSTTPKCIAHNIDVRSISHAFSPIPSSPNYQHLRRSMEPRRELWQADEDAQKEYSFELVGINRKIGFPRRRCAVMSEIVDDVLTCFIGIQSRISHSWT